MRVGAFLEELRFRLDGAAVRKAHSTDIIAVFYAPNGGFCGRGIRPKLLNEMPDGGGRYGLTRKHVERILVSFDVTLPPRVIE